MSDLKYSVLRPQDMGALQAMIQGTEYCSLCFNMSSQLTLAAHHHGQLVGFMVGQRLDDDQPDTLTLTAFHLHSQYQDPQHVQDMALHFINWARGIWSVTDYRLNIFDTAHPIGIDHLIPDPVPADDLPAMLKEFAYA
jgi:hypothetical protein